MIENPQSSVIGKLAMNVHAQLSIYSIRTGTSLLGNKAMWNSENPSNSDFINVPRKSIIT